MIRAGPGRAGERFAALMEEARGLVSRSERVPPPPPAVQREAEAGFLEYQCNVPLLHERAFWMISPRCAPPPPPPDANLQPQLWRDLSLGVMRTAFALNALPHMLSRKAF